MKTLFKIVLSLVVGIIVFNLINGSTELGATLYEHTRHIKYSIVDAGIVSICAMTLSGCILFLKN